MATWYSNRLILKGDKSYLEPLHHLLMRAPKDADADGWRSVVVELFSEQGVTYDVGEWETPPFDTSMVFDASTHPASLTLEFHTAGGTELFLAGAMAKILPLSEVSLMVKELTTIGVTETVWVNGQLSHERGSEYAWDVGGGTFVYWVDADEPHFTRDDVPVTEDEAIRILDEAGADVGSLVHADDVTANLLLALLTVNSEETVLQSAERLEKLSPEHLPRERLVKAVGATEEELDGVPDSWLLKLLISQKSNNTAE